MAAADSKRDGGNGARYGEMARKAGIVTGNGRERKRENRRAHTHTYTESRTNEPVVGGFALALLYSFFLFLVPFYLPVSISLPLSLPFFFVFSSWSEEDKRTTEI